MLKGTFIAVATSARDSFKAVGSGTLNDGLDLSLVVCIGDRSRLSTYFLVEDKSVVAVLAVLRSDEHPSSILKAGQVKLSYRISQASNED